MGTNIHHAGALLAALLALSISSVFCQTTLTCEEAEDIHIYALETLGSCEDPATQNTPLCGLIGEALDSKFTGNFTSSRATGISSDQLFYINNPDTGVSEWQNYLTQSALSSVADIGEVTYILTQVSEAYGALNTSDIDNDEYFSSWSDHWWAQADYNLAIARNTSNNYDDLSKVATYFKAANYYFTGSWPYAFTTGAINRSRAATDAFRAGLNAHPTWKNVYFNASFNNGTATAQLPGILITPDATRKLPLIIITTGTDFTKEETFLQFARDAVARNYAVLVYEGPGQGAVIKNPPYMPFYPQWEDVLLVILNYVQSSLSQYVQLDKVAQYGVSLGGYLGTRGCAAHSDRLAACIPNPPQTSVTDVYNVFVEDLGQSVFAPFLYVAQNDPTLLPEEYREVFDDYPSILDALFLTCNATSRAPGLIADTFTSSPGAIDPELVYLAAGYGGQVSGSSDVLYSALWQGFNNAQEFADYPVENISVPVIGFRSLDDTLLGGQEEDFFDLLTPETRAKSVLLEYDPLSGGALHCQVGATNALSGRLFAALNPILKGASSPRVAPSQGPGTSRQGSGSQSQAPTLPILPSTTG